MIVSSDHWGLKVVQLCGMILKIALLRLTTFLLSTLCPFFAAETVMDTRVATAELGWTAYPNSGVSYSLPKPAHLLRKQTNKNKIGIKCYSQTYCEGDKLIHNMKNSVHAPQLDRQIGRKAGKMGV